MRKFNLNFLIRVYKIKVYKPKLTETIDNFVFFCNIHFIACLYERDMKE